MTDDVLSNEKILVSKIENKTETDESNGLPCLRSTRQHREGSGARFFSCKFPGLQDPSIALQLMGRTRELQQGRMHPNLRWR